MGKLAVAGKSCCESCCFSTSLFCSLLQPGSPNIWALAVRLPPSRLEGGLLSGWKTGTPVRHPEGPTVPTIQEEAETRIFPNRRTRRPLRRHRSGDKATMATELEELLGFLSSPSPPVRKAAVDIVSGLTGSEEGLRSLAARADLALPALCRLLGNSAAGEGVAGPAAEALVNLSQNAGVCEKLVSHGAVRTAVEVLYKQPQDGGGIHRLLVMLLVNLTQVDSGVNALLQVGDEKMEGLYVSKLVRSFCRSSAYETSGDDPFEHVGFILVNISKMEAGRKILLDPRRILLKQIIQQSDSANLLRKKGVSGTIRNCCFEADKQLQNLLSMSEFLWPALLLPVAGNKVYSQQDTSKMPPELANALSHERQPVDDPEIRTQALEAIYLICLQDAGRRALWSVNGPRMLQVGYEDEEDLKVMEAYEQIGSLLVGSGEAVETLSSDRHI
ncbi:hypothetical protein Taro_011396 [Colocasia esculenta]|uniref:Protein HGH1 homolog n=1 Tax=Colocasia esculenta TaxID=4460 RepID=A0A843UFX9_COLES|nr:hypothetical protein [Colocasia esculenta]